MSAVVIHRVRCDAPAADGYACMTEHDAPFPTRTVGELRRWLRAQGWHRTRSGRDICPECWAEGKR